MSSLRRPPIEFLFCVSFYFVSLCLEFCHNKTSFYWAGDPRSQEHRPTIVEKGARRARRRRNRWRQAMASLSCVAMPSTEGSAQPSTTLGGAVIPSPRPSFGHSRSRVLLVPELLRMVSVGCGHHRAAERPGLYQTQPLNLPLGAPRRAVDLCGFGSVRGLWFGVSPRALVSVRERTRPSTFPLIVVGRSNPSRRPTCGRWLRERRPFSDRAVDLYGRLCRQGPGS